MDDISMTLYKVDLIFENGERICLTTDMIDYMDVKGLSTHHRINYKSHNMISSTMADSFSIIINRKALEECVPPTYIVQYDNELDVFERLMKHEDLTTVCLRYINSGNVGRIEEFNVPYKGSDNNAYQYTGQIDGSIVVSVTTDVYDTIPGLLSELKKLK